MVKVSTSILSIKENLIDKIKILNNTNTDYIHLDIMDGIFVPNTSFDFDTIKEVTSNTDKKLDVHLMVSNPLKYIEEYKTINPEFITIHYEIENPIECIRAIKNNNIRVGVSIRPDTDVEKIYNLLHDIDLVLIMSVEPGKGGQMFISDTLNKVVKLRKYIDENKLNTIIEIDGGINNSNAKSCINSGVDILVSGSFITNSDNYENQISKLKN